MYFLCLDGLGGPAARRNARRAVVQLADDDGAVIATGRRPGWRASGVAADVVSPARRSRPSPGRSPRSGRRRGTAAAGGLPATVRFLPAAGLEPPEAAAIQARWAAGGRTTQRAARGLRADGPFVLDLAQGPHLLVAGTSGSGKSELLQTLVARSPWRTGPTR